MVPRRLWLIQGLEAPSWEVPGDVPGEAPGEPLDPSFGDWGCGANREIDFGFGCGACVCACVRAKLCAGVRQRFLVGLGPRSRSLWGSAPCRAVPGPPGR